jgi:hypothetical protein
MIEKGGTMTHDPVLPQKVSRHHLGIAHDEKVVCPDPNNVSAE